MRVICIENSVWQDGPHAGQICAHKGSVYHVTGSVEGQELREKTGIQYGLGAWYGFLELSGIHHSMRFLEIPEDDVEEEVQERTLQLNNQNN